MFQKIKAGEIQVGDLVARARTHPFHKVTRLVEGPVAVAIYYDTGGKDRPRKSADWWRKLPDEGYDNPALRALRAKVANGEAEAIAGIDVRDRLEYLRGELRAERISWGELNELQSLAEHIEPGDVELLEAAGVPEFEEQEPSPDPGWMND